MKQLIVTVIAVACFGTVAFSQTKPLQTAKIKTPNALCEADKKRIETYLNRYDGITYYSVNFRKGETTVKFLTDRINIEEIKTAIANIGYDADDVTASEEAYKRLPLSCKKAEDGGGHKKPKPVPADTPAQ